MFGSGNAILIISNEEINDIMKIVKSPEKKKKKKDFMKHFCKRLWSKLV